MRAIVRLAVGTMQKEFDIHFGCIVGWDAETLKAGTDSKVGRGTDMFLLGGILGTKVSYDSTDRTNKRRVKDNN